MVMSIMIHSTHPMVIKLTASALDMGMKIFSGYATGVIGGWWVECALMMAGIPPNGNVNNDPFNPPYGFMMGRGCFPGWEHTKIMPWPAPQRHLLQVCVDRGIAMVIYRPLNWVNNYAVNSTLLFFSAPLREGGLGGFTSVIRSVSPARRGYRTFLRSIPNRLCAHQIRLPR
jgi:hypothetical protein